MITIQFFLILGLALLVIVLIVMAIPDFNDINGKKNKFRWVYFACFILLGGASIVTVKTYLYPKDPSIFKNTDYHILEHKGFRTDSVFYLAYGQFPDKTLWDNKSGMIKLTPDSVIIEDYLEPFFIEQKSSSYRKPDSLNNHKKNYFVLANKVISTNIDTDGLLLTKDNNGSNDTLLYLKIIYAAKDNKACYIVSSSRCAPDTSQFHTRINRGYPISDIIAQCPRFDYNEDLQFLLEGCLLVRDSILISNNCGAEFSKNNTTPLIIMPSSNLFYSDIIRINGKPSAPFHISAPYKGLTLFYSGIGKSKTDVYSLHFNQDNETLEIRYVLPKMQKLKAEGGRLFISSSVATILDDSKDGGYYYNIFESERNFNHINGEIRYDPGTARDSLTYEILDIYSPNPSEKINMNASDGNQVNEFELSVLANSEDKTKWIFDVLDLRESNPLTLNYIVLFVLVYIFLIGFRLLVDSCVSPRSLSFIELSAYVVVFCLSVVRLIIGWRVSTFVPFEDVTASVFEKMRSSTKDTIWLVCSIPFIITLLSTKRLVISLKDKILSWKLINIIFLFCKKLFTAIKTVVAKTYDLIIQSLLKVCRVLIFRPIRMWFNKVWNSSNNKEIVLLYIVVLGICAIGSRGSLERLLNIPVPLISYIIFDYWLVRREEKYEVTTARVFIILISFVYLFTADAGFTVIFFVFLFLYHAVIGSIINGNIISLFLGKKKWNRITNNGKRNWPYYLSAFVFVVLLLLFLKYEGSIMIWAFNHVGYVLLMLGVICTVLYVFSIIAGRRSGQSNLMIRIIYAGSAIILLALSLFELNPSSSHFISDGVNSKVHMKYRAEVQKLRENEMIDDLIEKSDFKSTDITYIMRSAHNQWFINQYLRAGESLKNDNRYFVIQPHSNQGSTYTTQTTDLVITRYLIAEHGNDVVICVMTLFLFLILVYIFEIRVQSGKNRVMMGPIILLFVIALMVFLSATNRVVFVGQDFPFLSIQSRVAMIFPLALLFLSILSVTIGRLKGNTSTERRKVYTRKWAILVEILCFSVGCVLFIKQQGKKQNEDQFDVSKIIQSLSQEVEILDKSLMKYQTMKNTNTLSKDSLWRAYSKDVEFSAPLLEIMQDESEERRFYRSLIEYFDTRQAIKNNPEELLHMRKRSGYWHLAVNKKHFFIPSMLEENLPWHGDLLAAKTNRLFSFKSTHDIDGRTVASTDNYEKNVLPRSIRNKVVNVQMSLFDSSWVSTGKPLILINSYQSKGSPQFFHIESNEISIKGSSSQDQIATKINEGDLVMVHRMNRGEEEEVLGWKYGQDNENYLAKNIWMNGNQKLFYPLGKESMWSYQFANAVSNSFGKSDVYRDSTLRISIDYDLHKEFYSILSQQNKTKMSLKASTVQMLEIFEELPFGEMRNRNNVSDFFYNTDTKRIEYKGKKNIQEVKDALKKINSLIAKVNNDMDRESQISNAIDQVIERKFDFSAVVLDGNGRIRLLFDHTRSRNIDPNNIRYFNKFMSDLYKNGDNQSERDVFGNKALQLLPSGPGSSFKPVAYTSITSQEKIAWEQLDVLTDYMSDAKAVLDPKSVSATNLASDNIMYDFYGGVDCKKLNQPLSIDGTSGLQHNNYLIYSNNLYHSAIILLGMQPRAQVERVFKTAGSDKYSFPVMRYRGNRVSFDPNIWFSNNNLNLDNGIMNDGLYYNFHLLTLMVNSNDRYTNYYGNTPKYEMIFNTASSYKAWTYAETGSQNLPDRKLDPQLRNGFNQMLLGAYPLEVTPLQMATMGMRLATLNRTDYITTLEDERNRAPEYAFFEVPSWDEAEYFSFYKRQVLSQLREVPHSGTARALNGLTRQMEGRGFYLYAKTGTLNDGRVDAKKSSRMKHLLVIIANKPLETIASIEELKTIKYYVIYLSYIGVDISEGFSTSKFSDMIKAVADSELFNEYMKE